MPRENCGLDRPARTIVLGQMGAIIVRLAVSEVIEASNC